MGLSRLTIRIVGPASSDEGLTISGAFLRSQWWGKFQGVNSSIKSVWCKRVLFHGQGHIRRIQVLIEHSKSNISCSNGLNTTDLAHLRGSADEGSRFKRLGAFGASSLDVRDEWRNKVSK